MKSTRDFIIDEAYKLFLKQSYEAVSISDISQAIGFTKGALYHHFVNKEDLFKAVVDKYLWLVDPPSSYGQISLKEYLELGVQKAYEIIKNLLDPSLDFETIDFISLSIAAIRHYPGFVEEKGKYLELEIGKTKIILDHAIETGEIRGDINTLIMARNFHFLYTGLVGDLIHSKSTEKSIAMLREQLDELYHLLKK